MTGVLRIRTTKAFGESTVSKILELVENSSSHKSRSEDFISKFARVYTPAVCYGALALAVLPPVVRLAAGHPAQWGDWIYRALTFLVISCPCALVISIPLSFFARHRRREQGGHSDQGLATIWKRCRRSKTVVFDKTGTLTQGVFRGQRPSTTARWRSEKLLEYAALAECCLLAPHQQEPARGLRQGNRPQPRRATLRRSAARALPPRWTATRVAAGNDKLMELLGIAFIGCHSVGTIIHMAIDGAVRRAHRDLRRGQAARQGGHRRSSRHAGVEKTVMLTGDSRSAWPIQVAGAAGRGRGAQRAAARRQGGAGREAARQQGRKG